MIWAKTISVLLTVITVCLPAVASGGERLEAHVRQNVYPGAGRGAYLDAALAEGQRGLPPSLAALYSGDANPWRPSRLNMPGLFRFNFEPQSLLFLSGSDGHAGGAFSRWNLAQRIRGEAGMSGAELSYPFADGTALSAFGAFNADSGDPFNDASPGPDHAYGIKMAARASILDMAIRYAEAQEEGADAGFPSASVLIPVQWRLISAGVNADMGNVGLHAEGGRTWLKTEDGTTEADTSEAYTHFLVGVDYTFENNLYLVLEYFQDGRIEAADDDRPAGQPGLLTGDGKTLGRDNFLVGARYPLSNLASIEFYNIVNAGEASIMVNPWLILNAGDAFSLKLSAQIPFSKKDKPLEDLAPAAFGGIQINF